MTDRLDKLEQLIGLAHERSSDRRRELLRSITDIFLDKPETHSSEASAHFGGIMKKVAYELEVEVRAELAERLSEQAAAPYELIRKLASDEIEVAQPVLKASPVLTQHDLMEVAENRGQDHLHAITHRRDIGEDLSEKLVQRGDDRVVEGLVRNKTAAINRNTMENIVHRAQRSTNNQLDAPLVDRTDLPPDLMQEMFWSVSKDLRERILEQTSKIDESKLDRALAEIEAKFEDRPAMPARTISKPQALVNRLARQGELNEPKLVEFARTQQIPELICALAKMAEIDHATAKRILFDQSGEGLTIACRASDFERNTYSAFLLSVDPGNPRSIQETSRLLSIYDKMDRATAQRIMRFWRVRKETMDRGSVEAA